MIHFQCCSELIHQASALYPPGMKIFTRKEDIHPAGRYPPYRKTSTLMEVFCTLSMRNEDFHPEGRCSLCRKISTLQEDFHSAGRYPPYRKTSTLMEVFHPVRRVPEGKAVCFIDELFSLIQEIYDTIRAVCAYPNRLGCCK